MISRQFALFVVAGGTAAAVNFGARILFSTFMPYAAAILAAYCMGMAAAFMLNRRFVFVNTSSPVRDQVAWFVAINLAAVLQTLLVSLLLRDWLFPLIGLQFHPETIAHGIGVIVPVFVSYIGHKCFTFRNGPV